MPDEHSEQGSEQRVNFRLAMEAGLQGVYARIFAGCQPYPPRHQEVRAALKRVPR